MLNMARRRAGLSQRELSRRAGVPQSTISRIESGLVSPSIQTLEKLVRACGMELEVVDRLGIGVDRSLIREYLELTPADRAHAATSAAQKLQRTLERATRVG